ncbi:MAG: ABC transporter substrate-binding protein [Streptosporangiales bacterium]|nr:ABC transporter substrate-binding protein [Streptosporangiales bacterium]MBO0891554.1 ABC transporter substrate-binding protein [Acidothermales bacterium]
MKLAPWVRAALIPAVVVALTAVAGCDSGSASGSGEDTKVRVGYFPNLTHAPAIVGVRKGFFAKELGSSAKLSTQTFNAGPAEVEALFSGAIDIAYIGPNPTINAWQKSKGQAVRVIAGAASGGAALVVKPGIKKPADLRGEKIATPQLGNTQDVALRYWLKQKGFATTQEGGGDVKVLPQENSQTLQTFSTGDIDGAWVPEPYASRLVLEGKGHELVDEKSLWPQGKFVTTQVVVRTQFLNEHPDVVKRFLRGHVDAVDYLNQDPAAAQKEVNAGLAKLSGKPLSNAAIARAWQNLTFTDDPIASSLRTSAQHAEAVGLLKKVDLDGLYDVGPLNGVLRAKGEPAVSAS